MKTVVVPEEIHTEFKVACALRGVSLKDGMLEALAAWIRAQATKQP